MQVAQAQDFWSEILKDIRSKTNEITVKTWLEPLRFEQKTESQWVLHFPNTFFKGWVLDNFADKLEDSLKKVCGSEAVVDYEVDERLPEPTGQRQINSRPQIHQAMNQLKLSVSESRSGSGVNYSFDSEMTFQNFITGSNNQIASAAARAVAERPGGQYNPLFLYSNSGLGKTHLMHAIGNQVLSSDSSMKVCYAPCEFFVNEVVEGIRFQKMDKIRNKYRDNVDVLLIDDIHMLAGKASCQEEFFHTFNHLVAARKQVVITSDKLPKEIGGIEERLRTRFEQGLMVDIAPPDLETRLAVLRAKAEREQLVVPPDVLTLIATNVRNNIRELEGALKRLGAYASIRNVEIDLPLAREVLKDILNEKINTVTIENIQKVVANHFKLKVQDLRGASRAHSIVVPRQVAVFLCRRLTTKSYPEIGAAFGGRDHTTVIHSYEKINGEVNAGSDIKKHIDSIEALL